MQSSDHPARRAGDRGAGVDEEGLHDTLDAPGADADAVRQSRIRALDTAASDDYAELKSVDPDHYVLGAEVAAGGMGRVIKARDRRLGREVAIKELLPDRRDAALRFEAEARITARLQHPAIVNVYEAGVWPNGDPFYAMTMVAGRSLDEVVAERDSFADRLGLLPNVIAAVDALAYAHSERIVHRDLKPQNVLIGEFGETVVIDWGLAKDLNADPSAGESLPRLSASRSIVTGAGGVVGTPAYMPPEQARGEPIDKRADVYALGALLRFVVTGRAPVTGKSARAVLDQVLTGAVEPIDNPQVPPDLVAIINKAMAFDPADRYRTARELAADLKRFQTGQLVGAYQYSRRERLARWVRRHRAVLAVLLIALGILIALGVIGLRRIIAERATAERGRADLLQLQGRQMLLAGRPGAALAYLSHVYSDGFYSDALRLLIAEASRPYQTEFFELAGHDRGAIATAFTPNDDRLMTASRGGTVAMWDAATGRQLWTANHGAAINHAELDPDGRRVVTCGADGTARIWNAADGNRLLELSDGKAATYVARFSPTQDQLATASSDGVARVWDLTTGDVLARMSGHEDAINDVAFDPQGERIATAGEDRTARVWSIDGEQLALMRGHGKTVRSVVFSEDGLRVLTASRDATARVWEADTGELVAPLEGHRDEITFAMFSRGGWDVVTASADGTARVWDADTGRLRAILSGHDDAVTSAKFSHSGELVVTSSNDRAVRVWDWMGEKTIVLLEGHAGTVTDASFDSTDTRIASASSDTTARIWDATNRTLRHTIEAHTAGVRTAEYDATGERILSAGSDPTARVWDAATRNRLATIEESNSIVYAASFSPSGDFVATGTRYTGDVAVWNAKTGALVQRMDGHEQHSIVFSTRWSPDGKRLATAGSDAVAHVWNATTGDIELTLSGHSDYVYSAVFSPDGRRITTTGADGLAILWDARTGERITDVRQQGQVFSAAFSRDGRLLATAGSAGASVWRIDGSRVEPVAELKRPGWMYSAAFSPDGVFLVTAGRDWTVRVWDAKTGEQLASREGHTDRVLSARFGPNADSLLTASEDGTVRVWEFHLESRTPDELAQFVKEHVPWAIVSGKLVRLSGQGDDVGAR